MHSLTLWDLHILWDLYRSSLPLAIDVMARIMPVGQIYRQNDQPLNISASPNASTVKKSSRYAVVTGLTVNWNRCFSVAVIRRKKAIAIHRCFNLSGYFLPRPKFLLSHCAVPPTGHIKHQNRPTNRMLTARMGCHTPHTC